MRDAFTKLDAKTGADHMNIIHIFLYALMGSAAVLIALLSGLWWLTPGDTWVGGAIGVLILWGFAFNKLPTQGLECLKDKFNMRFVLPLAVLSTLGFIIGFFK